MKQNQRIDTIDALRGIASLAVCWFHLTNGNNKFLPEGILKLSGAYGWLGVEVFFVLSGFVIPFALWRANYKLSNYSTFVYKRVVRLDPPYITSILVVIVLAYISFLMPGFRGEKPSYSMFQIILHLGYMNPFFGYSWINIIYWTLAIEFQYYLIIGLVYPLIVSKHLCIRYAALFILGLLAFLIPQDQFIFHWISLFILGLLVFYYKVGLISGYGFFVSLFIATSSSYIIHGAVICTATFVTSLVIAFVKLRNKLATFLGDLSYSLYLMHVPIGGRMINLGTHFSLTTGGRVLVLMMAMGLSIIAAYAFYRIIEKPVQRWSSNIAFNPRGETHPVSKKFDFSTFHRVAWWSIKLFRRPPAVPGYTPAHRDRGESGAYI